MNRTLADRLRCYLITDSRAEAVDSLVHRSAEALLGGMTAVQLRAPGWSDRRLLEAALRLREVTREYNALLLLNDRIDLTLAAKADGVHLGVDDLPIATARCLLGDGAIIGYSPDGLADAQRAVADGASYLGVGPVFPTSTKADAGEPIGVAGIRAIAEALAVPVVGVGGITLGNARMVTEAGAVGVALVSAVFLADDPRSAAQTLRDSLR